jgi:hypothetical protein
MKLRTLFTGALISIGLIAGGAVGSVRGFEISQNVLDAYQSSSIDEYLGIEVAVDQDACNEVGNKIKLQLSSSKVPSRVETLVNEFSATFESGKAKEKTFSWFKRNQEIKNLNLSGLDTVGVPELKNIFGFDAAQTVNEVIDDATSSELEKEITKVLERGQLPSGVSTRQWNSPFEVKLREACKEQIKSAGAQIESKYNADIGQFRDLIDTVIRTNWTSKGFEKITPLVAYQHRPTGFCSGRSNCALFYIETSTSCAVDLKVKFSRANDSFVSFGYKTVRTSSAKSRIAVQVNGGIGAGGYYEIVEATCR